MIMVKKDAFSQQKKQDVVGYRPRVVVKFHDYVELPYEDGVEKHIEKLSVGPWRKLLDEFPGLTFKRLYTSLDSNEIQKLVDRATELDSTYSPPNLLTYFTIDVPPSSEPKSLADALLSWQSVQTAYFDPPGEEPQVSPGDDPRFGNQGYLDPAPDGIDAEFAWPRPDGTGFPGGDGANQRVIDLERGWTLNHEDLTGHGATLLHGSILDTQGATGRLCWARSALWTTLLDVLALPLMLPL
jgi:hypothetical protein